jgi:hypothetical protein
MPPRKLAGNASMNFAMKGLPQNQWVLERKRER